MTKLDSLKQPESLTKLAYDALLKPILSGQLKPGEVYNENGLATELGISRTPVHEALVELSIQGLVTFLPRKGVVINSFTEQDIEEIFEVRKALEVAVAEKAALETPCPDLTDCRKALEEQRKALSDNDHKAFIYASHTFHMHFGGLTRNQRMLTFLGNIRNLMELIGVSSLSQYGRMSAVVKEHELIIEAIERGNPDDARKAMIEHIEKSEQTAKESIL